MRFFICALGKVFLGIPAGFTERIIPLDREQSSTCETENGETFISLPALFKLENKAAPHGLILKPACAEKTTLLLPKIDKDMEIQEDEIHELPNAFSGLYCFFRGAYVDGDSVILILDPKKLAEGVK